MKNYTQDEIKKIAREFLSAVKSKTGWKATEVVYSNYGAKPILTVHASGWSNGTEVDDHAKHINPDAQKKLEDYWKIEDTFNKKYKDIGFSLSGGGSGERVASSLKRIAKDLLAMPRLLKCVSDGRVEVTKGEARSADAKIGDTFRIKREDKFRFYGTLNAQGNMFRHDPGLSGKKTNHGLTDPNDVEIAILKENINGYDNGMHGESRVSNFWARWRVV